MNQALSSACFVNSIAAAPRTMAGKQKGELANMRTQLAECHDKIGRLEFDRTALQHRLRDLQESARKEANELKAKAEEIKVKYAKPPESEKTLDALSKAVLNLYIEFKDRLI